MLTAGETSHDQNDPDQIFMRMALEQAEQAFDKGEVPVGAIAVYRGKVIGRAHNQKETHGDPTAHAEILALQEAALARGGWRLPGVTLYCTLEPCAMCAGAMIQARLPHLVYSIDDPKAGACGSVIDLLHHPQLNHHVQVRKGVLEAEARALLNAFFLSLRDGAIPRFSEAWKQRQLASNSEFGLEAKGEGCNE